MLKIWEHYFFKEFTKTVVGFLAVFFGLYILIDYASHAASFYKTSSQFQWTDAFQYYASELLYRLEVLLPFALLAGTIKTLSALNTHNELVALISSGLSLKRLALPFLTVALLCTGFMYINTQFFLPAASPILKQMEEHRSSERHQKAKLTAVQNLSLEDNSLLLFQRYDAPSNALIDAYWIRSIDDIYRIKTLYIKADEPSDKFLDRSPLHHSPLGRCVDHFTRSATGELILVEKLPTKEFLELHFGPHIFSTTLIPPETQSLSQLTALLPSEEEIVNEKEAQLLTIFIRKLWMPWLCLLAVLGPMPFCWRYARNSPLFLIYAISIFSLFGFYLLINASAVLGKRQILSPLWAISSPFIGAFTWAFLNFFRMK